MNIIFGTEAAEKLSQKYTVLELDTFRFQDSPEEAVAYCILDNMPLDEMQLSKEKSDLHAQMIESFKHKEWAECANFINELMGSWDAQVDTFYEDIKGRVELLIEEAPEDWSATIVK